MPLAHAANGRLQRVNPKLQHIVPFNATVVVVRSDRFFTWQHVVALAHSGAALSALKMRRGGTRATSLKPFHATSLKPFHAALHSGFENY